MRQFVRISGQVAELTPGDNRTAISAGGEDDEANDNGHRLPLSYFERGYGEGLSVDLGKLVFEGLNKLVKCLVANYGFRSLLVSADFVGKTRPWLSGSPAQPRRAAF